MATQNNNRHNQVIRFLMNDHKTIRGLFRQMETVDLRAPEMKPGVARELFMELEVHLQVEEECFYPVVRENGEANVRAHVLQSIEEHQSVKEQIQTLRSLDFGSNEFDSGLDDLIQAVELHLEEEERDLFPAVEREFAQSLSGIAERMRERRSELISHPKYEGAQPEVAQDPHGGEQKRRSPAA